ncbi:MAG TPA: hypothetical protein VF377_10495 [Acidimicrobiia bacterium]
MNQEPQTEPTVEGDAAAAVADALPATTVKLTRRDLLEVERIAGKPYGRLFPDGEATAEGLLVSQYVLDKKRGATTKSYDEWLDEEVAEVELDDTGSEDESNPT